MCDQVCGKLEFILHISFCCKEGSNPQGPTHSQTICITQAVTHIVWLCVVWFDCATVWQFSNRLEFCCTTSRLCDSLKYVCTWLRVVPHQQFIIDSHTFRIFFSNCHIQLQIKNSSGNFFCPNTPFPLPVSVYGLFLSHISKNNCRTGIFGHIFVMTFPKTMKLAQTYRIAYGHSLLLYITLLRKFVWLCMGPISVRSPMCM